ncbi:MAG TPA: ubiquinone/menaquinone biosynthesis methyltransferase [Actinomycetota bacterium]|nr:ubiquinone/menaquinone biosynthesis methyltransferase [Actinomycetota bacterium]
MAGVGGRPPKELPTGEQKVQAVRSMFDAIAPRYDLVNRVMTFGMDRGWRRLTVDRLRLEPGSLVFDVACGTGDLCRQLRKSKLRAVGFDMSSGMLEAARTSAPLVLADGLNLPVRDGSADGVTCGFALRNVESLPKLFAEFARVIRPGGRVSLLEVAEPKAAILKAGHKLYFHKVVPVIGGLISDRSAYSYLPRSTAYLPPPEGLIRLLEEAGFTDIERKVLGLGAAQLLTGTRG